MLKQEGNLNAFYNVKEASLKRLYAVGFQLHDILENNGDSEKTSGCQGLGEGKDEEVEHRGFLGQ